MAEIRNAYRILVGKPEGERLFGGPRRRWEDNINRDLKLWTGLIWFKIGTSGGLL
jgi:hypothetical protein